MLEEAIDFAKMQSKAIVESGEEHQPILLILAPKNISTMMLAGLDKNMFKLVLSGLLRQLNAYAYIFINEAWSAKLSGDCPTTQRLLKGEISVSELPPDDREEILTIMAAENGQSCRMWTAKIQYTLDDKRYLGEWREMDGIGEGRMVLKEW